MMEHVERLAITIDNVENRAHHLDQFAARIANGTLANRRQHLDQLRDHRLANQRNNLVLAVEMKINGTGRDASLKRKLLDGCLMKRLPRKHAARSQKNLSPTRFDELVVLRRCT